MSPRKNAKFVVVAAIILLVAVVVLGITFVPPYILRTMSDFAALWNTTDALQHHVATTKQWPHDWDALSPSFAFVDPAYSDRDISFAKDRVEVNFDVEIGSPPSAGDWCVRLKSDRMKPEQESANKRLRDLIERTSQH